MANPGGLSTDELWRRVGLEELRHTIRQTEDAVHAFEQALKHLPTCNACARLALLEQLRGSSRNLGREAVGLQVLIATLQQTMDIVEREQAVLSEHSPTPCRCAGEPCRCHPST